MFTNATEIALLARENDIATTIIRLNKKSNILEDRLLALDLLVLQIKDLDTLETCVKASYPKFVNRETNNSGQHLRSPSGRFPDNGLRNIESGILS